MTTNEFIKKVKELGYETMVYKSSLSVYASHTPGIPLLSLETDQQFSLHIHSVDFNFFVYSDEDREKLYNLAIEYDKTPVEKREKEKRYRIRWDLSNLEERTSYLNRNEEGDIFFSNDRSTAKVQTVFTALEALWVSHFIVEKFLVQEEVKDDNEN